jgi:hypothetical protein
MAKANQPAVHLVVVSPFRDFALGARITDPETVKAIQEGEQAAYVVAVPAPAEDPKT